MQAALLTPTQNFWGKPVFIDSARTNPFNSDVSTAATIAIMRRLAHQYANDPTVCAATSAALAGGAYTQRDIAGAIFYWVRNNVKFVEDETLLYGQLGVAPANLDKELLIVPPVLLSMPEPMGDCDDFSLLTVSMLLNAGLRAFFVTVAADPADPHKFSHIYVCAELADEGTYLCLDPGNRISGIPPGWEAERVTRKAVWAI
jgi:hypothetical protein